MLAALFHTQEIHTSGKHYSEKLEIIKGTKQEVAIAAQQCTFRDASAH